MLKIGANKRVSARHMFAAVVALTTDQMSLGLDHLYLAIGGLAYLSYEQVLSRVEWRNVTVRRVANLSILTA